MTIRKMACYGDDPGNGVTVHLFEISNQDDQTTDLIVAMHHIHRKLEEINCLSFDNQKGDGSKKNWATDSVA